MTTADAWHYVRGDQQFGPVPFQVLQNLARSKDLSPEDLVWSEGMPEWVEARSVQGLCAPSFRPRTQKGSGSARRTTRRGARTTQGGSRPVAPSFGPTEGDGPEEDERKQKAERLALARASRMPGMIILASILNLLGAGLSSINAISLAIAAHAIADGEIQIINPEDTISFLNTLNAIFWVAAAAFTFVAIFVLLGKRAARPIQGILSILLSAGPTMALVQDPAQAIPWLVILAAMAPFGCLMGDNVSKWYDAKEGRLGRGSRGPRRTRRPAARSRSSRGRRR